MEEFDGATLLDERGQKITTVGQEGELCMKVSDCKLFWFSGYYGQHDRLLVDENGYYHTGDRANLLQADDLLPEFSYM